MRGPRLRPGRASTMQSRSFEEEVSPSTMRSARIAQTNLNDVDASIISLQDLEAELYWPLTEKALNAERARSRLDPRHPRLQTIWNVETMSFPLIHILSYSLNFDLPLLLGHVIFFGRLRLDFERPIARMMSNILFMLKNIWSHLRKVHDRSTIASRLMSSKELRMLKIIYVNTQEE